MRLPCVQTLEDARGFADGVSGIMNVVMVPMWVASGVFFASSNFPDAAQPFIRALPLSMTPVGILTLWGTLTFGAALRTFRWQ